VNDDEIRDSIEGKDIYKDKAELVLVSLSDS